MKEPTDKSDAGQSLLPLPKDRQSWSRRNVLLSSDRQKFNTALVCSTLRNKRLSSRNLLQHESNPIQSNSLSEPNDVSKRTQKSTKLVHMNVQQNQCPKILPARLFDEVPVMASRYYCLWPVSYGARWEEHPLQISPPHSCIDFTATRTLHKMHWK